MCTCSDSTWNHRALWLQVRMCERAYKILVEQVGFDCQDIVFDPNILTVGTGLAEHNNYAVDFINATREIKRRCPGCKISGGVSNIAFSFRGNEAVRRAFHSAFLHWGSKCGMDMGIVNAAQVRVAHRAHGLGTSTSNAAHQVMFVVCYTRLWIPCLCLWAQYDDSFFLGACCWHALCVQVCSRSCHWLQSHSNRRMCDCSA
jgi:Pterin binding enzyme